MKQRRRRAIIWLTAAAVLLAGSPHLNAAQERSAPAASSADQQDSVALGSAIDAAASGRQSAEVALEWLGNHFILSQGESVYIPFTVAVDRRQLPAVASAVYIRAISRSATPGSKPAWEALNPIEIPPDGRFARAMALPPGTYDVFVAVKERGVPSAKVGIVRHEVTVPSFPSGELRTSSIILARSLEQLPTPLAPEKQQDNPYVFGPLKVTPSTDDAAFAKNGDLQVLFWIYGASQVAGKPDVQVDFSFFHHRLPEGDKYFNRTNPQELSAKTLPAEFNLGQGHQLLSSLSVPLASFPPGQYRLEIKVTDRPSGKSLTNNVNFSVSAS